MFFNFINFVKAMLMFKIKIIEFIKLLRYKKLRWDKPSPKLFPEDLVPGISCKSIVANPPKKDHPISQKNKKNIVNKWIYWFTKPFLCEFFHEAFATSSRDQICVKKFVTKKVPRHVWGSSGKIQIYKRSIFNFCPYLLSSKLAIVLKIYWSSFI